MSDLSKEIKKKLDNYLYDYLGIPDGNKIKLLIQELEDLENRLERSFEFEAKGTTNYCWCITGRTGCTEKIIQKDLDDLSLMIFPEKKDAEDYLKKLKEKWKDCPYSVREVKVASMDEIWYRDKVKKRLTEAKQKLRDNGFYDDLIDIFEDEKNLDEWLFKDLQLDPNKDYEFEYFKPINLIENNNFHNYFKYIIGCLKYGNCA